MPALPVTSNGTIDASALGIAWDTDLTGPQILSKASYLTKLENSIRKWETASTAYNKPLNIINLDFTKTVPAKTFVITVGNGNAAPSPYKELKVSYVDTDPGTRKGYFFVTREGNEGAHEFGHLLGLADRYFEVYSIDSTDKEGERDSVPMARMMFTGLDGAIPASTEEPHKTPRYYPADNLMSNDVAVNWTLSEEQFKFIFNGQDEPAMPRNIVAIWDKSAAKNGGFDVPKPVDGIVIGSDGILYAGPNGTRPLAGYHTAITAGKPLLRPNVKKDNSPSAIAIRNGTKTIMAARYKSTIKWVGFKKIGKEHDLGRSWGFKKVKGKPIHLQQMDFVSQLAR